MRPPVLVAWATLIFFAGWQFGRPSPLQKGSASDASEGQESEQSADLPEVQELRQKLEGAQVHIEQQREVIEELRSQLENQQPTPGTISNNHSQDLAVDGDHEPNAPGPNIPSESSSLQSTTAKIGVQPAPMAHQQQLLRIVQIEEEITSTERNQNFKQFLKKVELEDLGAFESQFTGLAKLTPELQRSFGKYRGNLQFLSSDRQRGRVSLLLQSPSTKPYRAAVRVDVVDGLRDKTTYFGGLDQLKQLDERSAAIIIRSSERSFLQLYFLLDESTWIGNFYEKNAAGAYRRSGFVKLEKLDQT